MNRTHDDATLRAQAQAAAIFELLKSGTATAGTREAFQKITRTAAHTLGVRRASVWLLDAARTELVLGDLFDLRTGKHQMGSRLEASRYPAYFHALGWSRAIVAPDAVTDPRTCEFAAGYLEPLGIVSMMDAAIWQDGRARGVVCLESVDERRDWTPDEQHFAGSLADIASAAMSHEELRAARASARQSRDIAAGVFDAISDLVAVMRLSDRTLMYVNRSFEDYTGFKAADVIGQATDRLGLWADAERRAEWVAMLAADAPVREFEAGFRMKSGEVHTFELSCDRVTIAGEPCLVTVARDVSASKRHERQLAEVAQGVTAAVGESFFRSLVAHLARALDADIAMVGEYDRRRPTHVTTVAVQRDGAAAPNYEYELEGTPCANVLAGSEVCSYSREVSQRFPRDKGIESYVGAPLLDARGTPMGLLAVLFRRPLDEVAYAESLLRIFAARASGELERRGQLRTLEHLAHHDTLTRLANRELLRERMSDTLASRNEGTLVLLDLDRFKEINDTLGHGMGDVLLHQLGERLQADVPAGGLVARLGGDEFAAWFEGGMEASQARRRAHALIETVTRPFEVDGYRLHVGASAGIACAPRDATTADGLLRCADVAMYTAKREGGGVCFYSPAQDPYTAERLALLSDLTGACARGEMELHYQPRVSLARGRLRGFEALVRWNHPRLGRLAPGQFIPLAEMSDVVRPLTLWVLRESLRQQREWAQAGRHTHLSVNFSARHLLDDACAEQVADILAESRTAPGDLELEITESALINDPERATTMLENIRALGVQIAIDDYGTGYSSLSHLRRLPLHALKIDVSFVRNMLASAQDRVIVESTIGLAHNLGLGVVAEGIEDEATLAALRAMGCDEGQGFHIGRPMDATEAARWMASSPLARGTVPA